MVLAYTESLADPNPGQPSMTIEQLQGLPLILYRRFDQLFHDVCEAHNLTPNLLCRNDDARTTLLWAETGLATPSSRHRPSHRPVGPSSRQKPSTNRACAPN